MFKNFKKPWLIYLIFSLFQTFLWFRHGDILGAGEFGASFYNLNQLASISVQAWGNQVLGGSSGYTVASGPTFFVLGLIQSSGIPGVVLQASFFLVTIFLTLFSIDFFIRTIFPRAPISSRILAAFMYMFNFYSLVNVWNRFLPNTILFYSLLPILLALYIQGLFQKRYVNAVVLSLISAVLAYAFNGPAQTALYWFLVALISIFYFIKIKRDVFNIKFFGLHFSTWLFFNFWWVTQSLYYRSSSNFKDLSATFFTDLGNQFTLDALSQSLGQYKNLFLLKHGTFFTESARGLPFQWSAFYSHPISLIIQWLVLLVVVYFAIKKSKDIWVKFLLVLFILGIFLSKGNMEPFGEIFNILFSKISILQFYRNPFEKLGIIIAFSFSVLFGMSYVWIGEYLNTRKLVISKIVSGLLFCYLFVYLGFPYYGGLVFSSGNPPANNPEINYRIKVPEYYKDASDFFNQNKEQIRFTSFPLGGEGIFYDWEVGYSGIEPSGIIFNTPNISYNTTIPFFNEIAGRLERQFLYQDEFYKIAAILNSKYLLHREDVNFKTGKMRDPKTIHDRLEYLTASSGAMLSKKATFGKLKIYEIDQSVFLPRIYAASSLIETSKIGILDDILFTSNQAVIVKDLNEKKFINDELRVASAVHPLYLFRFAGPEIYPYSDDPSVLPYSERISTDPLYNFVYLRDMFNAVSQKDINSSAFSRIMFLGKRITETKTAIDIGNYDAVEKSLNNYKDYLKNTSILFTSLSSDSGLGEIWKSNLLTALGSHQVYLANLAERLPESHKSRLSILQTREMIINFLIENKIMPLNTPIKDNNFIVKNRQVYQFDVLRDGDYELVFNEKGLEQYFEIAENIQVQIDDKVEMRQVSYVDGRLSFGKFKLTEGKHEIGFNIFNTVNLSKDADELTLQADNNVGEYRIKVNDFNPYSKYKLSFKYIIRSGNPPKVMWSQNIDSEIDLNFNPVYEKSLPKDDYYFDTRDYQVLITPSSSADSAEIVFRISPWNDCERQFINYTEKCKDAVFYKQFNRVSNVLISDLKITRYELPEPVLLSLNSEKAEHAVPTITFEKIDQTKYNVNVKNVSEPFILVFSELFNSDWSAMIQNAQNDNVQLEHFLVNGYANGWWVDKNGDFQVAIEFLPQKYLTFGYLVSGTSILGGLFFIGYSKIKYGKNN